MPVAARDRPSGHPIEAMLNASMLVRTIVPHFEIVGHAGLNTDLGLAPPLSPSRPTTVIVCDPAGRSAAMYVPTARFADQFAVDPDIRRAKPAQNAGVPDEIDVPLPRIHRPVLRFEGDGLCCASLQQRNAQKCKDRFGGLVVRPTSAQAGLHDSAVITLPIQPIIQARLEGLSIIPALGKIKICGHSSNVGYGERDRLIPLRSDDLREEQLVCSETTTAPARSSLRHACSPTPVSHRGEPRACLRGRARLRRDVAADERGLRGSHVPFVIQQRDDRVIVQIHLAAFRNPLRCRIPPDSIRRFLLIVAGDDAYIPRTTEKGRPGTTTSRPWLYEAVHLSGVAHLREGRRRTHGHGDARCSRSLEQRLPKQPWELTQMEPTKRERRCWPSIRVNIDLCRRPDRGPVGTQPAQESDEDRRGGRRSWPGVARDGQPAAGREDAGGRGRGWGKYVEQ